MNPRQKLELARRARVMRALGQESRLCIVHSLRQGERNVTELTDEVGSDISTVSRHLSVLQGAGIVYARRKGRMVYYGLRAPCVLRFFECVDRVLEESSSACGLEGRAVK